VTLDTTVLHGLLKCIAKRGEFELPEMLKFAFDYERAKWKKFSTSSRPRE
jgi:hypothetical protein